MSFTTWEQAAESFDELLDEPGPVVILGVEYDRSRIVRTLDPINYRSELFNYVDSFGVDSDDLDGDLPC